MFLDKSKTTINGKTYIRCLLRESYREGKKVKHRTIANLSKSSPEEIRAIEIALKHKHDISKLTDACKSVKQRQGLSIGAVWTVYEIARQLGIDKALGATEQGKLGLWQVIARVIDQGSRLSAVRLAGYHAACDTLGLSKFNEDDLYGNLDWLCENQETIEDRLFKRIYRDNNPGIFLYDVTSSYLEGTDNELSAFGYNRDGKKGKRQIVIGLLCNEQGIPLSIEVFSGNTQDPKTFSSQIKKAAKRFGSESVTFVGDRGMIKSGQIAELNTEKFHYITAITKAQIKDLLNRDIIQMSIFETELAEVKTAEGVRYVLRCNPVRAEEIRESRQDKLKVLQKKIQKYNEYLKEHQRAKTDNSVKKIKDYSEQLKISGWVLITAADREITVTVDNDALREEEKLDGCYVLKTDLLDKAMTKEIIHNRYKDLALVERAFRSSKTVDLEMRPVHVRLATRTRGHAFVVMLAYRIVNELVNRWEHLNITVGDGIKELATLCANEVSVEASVYVNDIPNPRESVKRLLDAANVRLPKTLPHKGIKVTTKKNLASRRKTQ